MALLIKIPLASPAGVLVVNITVTMPPGSNTIEGNGKVDSSREQVDMYWTSKANSR